MKIGQKYFSVLKASLIYLERMEKNNVKRRIGERLSAKCTKKTVKFWGGSVMVFGMFSSQGTTPLVRLQTRVNAQIYKNIDQDHVVPIIQNSGFDRATFMQDNAPCHKAKVVMSYLSEQDFEIMDWPPQTSWFKSNRKSLEDLRSESYGKKSH